MNCFLTAPVEYENYYERDYSNQGNGTAGFVGEVMKRSEQHKGSVLGDQRSACLLLTAGSICRFSNLLQGTSASVSKICSSEAGRHPAVTGTSSTIHLMTDAKHKTTNRKKTVALKNIWRFETNRWQMRGKKVAACTQLHTVAEPVINCVIPLCNRNIWSLRFRPWIPGAKSEQRTVHGHLRLRGTGRSFHSRLNVTLKFPFALTDVCSFCPPPERGRALCILRGRCGRHGSGWGWLVDGPKERQHWTSSRFLPGQRMTLLWTPGLCQTSTERKPTAALLLWF